MIVRLEETSGEAWTLVVIQECSFVQTSESCTRSETFYAGDVIAIIMRDDQCSTPMLHVIEKKGSHKSPIGPCSGILLLHIFTSVIHVWLHLCASESSIPLFSAFHPLYLLDNCWGLVLLLLVCVGAFAVEVVWSRPPTLNLLCLKLVVGNTDTESGAALYIRGHGPAPNLMEENSIETPGKTT